MAVVTTLAEVKTHLNITSTTYDTELGDFIDATTDIIEGLIGSVVPTSFTEVHDGGRPTIILNHAPVQSIDSITEYVGNTVWTLTAQPVGQSVNSYGYTLDDPLAGLVTRRGSGSYPQTFLGGPGGITVTYTAGRATVPRAVSLAARIIIASLWTTQRGAASLPLPGSSSDVAVPGLSGAIPSMALELIENTGLMRVPGVG